MLNNRLMVVSKMYKLIIRKLVGILEGIAEMLIPFVFLAVALYFYPI